MKIISAESYTKLTLKFTRLDIIRLAEICSKLDETLDTAADLVNRGAVNIDHVDIEKAGGGLELLWEILKNAEDIR